MSVPSGSQAGPREGQGEKRRPARRSRAEAPARAKVKGRSAGPGWRRVTAGKRSPAHRGRGRGAIRPGSWGASPCRSDRSGLPCLSLAVTRGRHFPAGPRMHKRQREAPFAGSPHNALGAFLPGKGDELAEVPRPVSRSAELPAPSSAANSSLCCQADCRVWTLTSLRLSDSGGPGFSSQAPRGPLLRFCFKLWSPSSRLPRAGVSETQPGRRGSCHRPHLLPPAELLDNRRQSRCCKQSS